MILILSPPLSLPLFTLLSSETPVISQLSSSNYLFLTDPKDGTLYMSGPQNDGIKVTELMGGSSLQGKKKYYLKCCMYTCTLDCTCTSVIKCFGVFPFSHLLLFQ